MGVSQMSHVYGVNASVSTMSHINVLAEVKMTNYYSTFVMNGDNNFMEIANQSNPFLILHLHCTSYLTALTTQLLITWTRLPRSVPSTSK